jgi:hypothetical protein
MDKWISSSTRKAPAWMVEFVEFRQRLFLQTVEPIIVGLLGPALPESQDNAVGISLESILDAHLSLLDVQSSNFKQQSTSVESSKGFEEELFEV